MDDPQDLKFTDPFNRSAGRFCTLVNIGHTPEFFAMDYRSVTPEGDAWLLGRYFLTPQHAKRLLQTLAEHIKGFEEEYGTIDPGEPMAEQQSPN